MEEEEIIKLALSDVEKSTRIKADPVVSVVTDWSGLMPAYQKNHEDTVASLENFFASEYKGIYLAGCSYYGVGIVDCIENGRITAQKVLYNKMNLEVG